MKNLLKWEEVSMLLLAIFALALWHVPWWMYILLALAPDISFLGFIAGKKAGTVCYNFFHHKGVAVVVFAAGLFTGEQWLQVAGTILFGHASMDRVLGFDLRPMPT